MLDIEQMDPDVLDGDYKLRKDAIGKCALAAIKRRSKVFAIQDGGKCLISNSYKVFDEIGISQDCKSDGKGGPGTSNAYVIGKISGMNLFSWIYYEELGRERSLVGSLRVGGWANIFLLG